MFSMLGYNKVLWYSDVLPGSSTSTHLLVIGRVAKRASNFKVSIQLKGTKLDTET